MRDFLIFAAYRLLGALIGPLPPRLGYGLARPVGALVLATSPQLRRALTWNMSHVLGPDASEDELRTVVRKACANIIRGHYDLLRLARLSQEEMLRMARFEGVEHIEKALALGKGVIMLSAHFGNVDILLQLPTVRGVPISTPVARIRPERLFQYMLRLRTSRGMTMYPTDGPMIGLYRALRRGEMVGLAADRGLEASTRRVEFFGAPADLPEGPVRLALSTGASVVPAFSLRLPDHTFVARVEPALELPRTGDREADLAAGLELVAGVLERVIAQHPEQWMLTKPVWPMNGCNGIP